MEIPGADAGDIRTALHLDMRNLGVHFQALHTEDDPDARILHLLRPVDIGSLIKTCQEFDDHRHLLPVACRGYQGFHHLRLFGKAVKGNLDSNDLLAHRRFLQYADKRVETMVRYMNETVFLLDFLKNAFRPVQALAHDRRPRRIFQVRAVAIGETHKVFVVLIASSRHHRIVLVHIQLV